MVEEATQKSLWLACTVNKMLNDSIKNVDN